MGWAGVWSLLDVAAALVAMTVTGFLIPQILLIAFRRQLFDAADDRKIHQGQVPRLGGIAFLPSMLCSLSLVTGLAMRNLPGGWIEGETSMVSELFLLCALTLIFLVGMADDLVGVRYRGKFLAQIVCGILIASGGITVSDLHGLFWIHEIPSWAAWAVTIFIVVFICNAINLIDGIDGLASGLSVVALCFYGVILNAGGSCPAALLAWCAVGTLLPFFYFNVFGNPRRRRKIFMGDTGALTIGLTLSFLAIAATDITPDSEAYLHNPVVLAFSPVVVPAFDVMRVYLHRVANGRNPFLPDRSHIHHKLLALGMPQQWALVAILLAAALFTLANVLLAPLVQPTWILAGDLGVWTIGNVLLTRAIRRRERARGERLYF